MLVFFVARQSVPGRRLLSHNSLSDRLPIQTTQGIIEQVANLLCVYVNSASYPQQDGKQVVAYGQ